LVLEEETNDLKSQLSTSNTSGFQRLGSGFHQLNGPTHNLEALFLFILFYYLSRLQQA